MRSFKQAAFEFKIENHPKLVLPLLIDQEMDLNIEVNYLDTAIHNIRDCGFQLADIGFHPESSNHSRIHIDLLLGVDVLQFLQDISYVKCLNGQCLKFKDKVIPMGDVRHFLHD